MKNPEEYIKLARMGTDHWADQEFDEYLLKEAVKQAQIDAYNEALDDMDDIFIKQI